MADSIEGTLMRRCRPPGQGLRAPAAGAFLTIFWLGAASDIAAQGVTTATLSGRVTTADGAPLAGARMELRRDDMGASRTGVTDVQGRYYFPNLRPGGPYTLEASRIGLRTVTRENLFVSIGQHLVLDLGMVEIAVPLPELEVEVESDPEFARSRMGPATVVPRRSLEELPTISRDFTEFAELSPLVIVDETGVSVAGSNIRFNNIQVDGALNQDVFGLSRNGVAGGRAGGRVIPLSAVEELQVLVAPYDVRQSGFTGGVLNAVTRSGTNDFRGAAFGFYRNEALVGDALIRGTPRSVDRLDNLFAGFDVSGPIVRDRIHFFAAGELESRRKPPDGFLVGLDDPVLTQLVPDTVARLSAVLSGFGADAGEAGEFTLDNDLANLFARLDVQIDGDNSAMLRYSFARADDDPAPNRLAGDAYELSSNATQIEARNHSIVAQWLSSFSPTLSNDLLVSAQFLRDRETPRARYAQVELPLSGVDGEVGFTRDVRAGADFLAADDRLEQDIVQVTEALTWSFGAHRLTAGGGFERFSIRRDHLSGSLGAYRFRSLADLEANAPLEYVVNAPVVEDAAVTELAVNQFSGFIQGEFQLGDAVTVQLGTRVDIPTMPDTPASNPDVASSFGFDTGELPSGRPVLSPRLGFNLRPGPGTQIRGGAGVFTGRPLFAWLAEAYQNDGLRAGFVTCRRRNVGVPDPEIVPAFDPTRAAPTACADGSGAGAAVPTVTVFDPDFDFPQDFKASIGLDQRLPAGVVLSLDAVYTKAVNQIFLRDLNLGSAVPPSERIPENGYTDGFGFGQREAFGDAGAGDELFDPPPGIPPQPREPIFIPRRVDDRFGQVVLIGNRSSNFAYAVSARLRKRFGERLAIDAGYAFNRSADLQSLASLDAVANFGFTAIERDPNRPTRQPSLFDRPHKVVATVATTLPERWGSAVISLRYVGQSGQPYSYVYGDDINADGYPGLGQALDLDNDLIFVNESLFDFPSRRSGISGILFEQLVSQEPCLQRNRLSIVSRNACRTPWSNQLDLRVDQPFRIGGLEVDVTFDVLNLLNLIDRDWGQVQAVNPVVRVISVPGREVIGNDLRETPEVQDPLEARYIGALDRGPSGGVRAIRPFAPRIGASQWQAQLGVRIALLQQG